MITRVMGLNNSKRVPAYLSTLQNGTLKPAISNGKSVSSKEAAKRVQTLVSQCQTTTTRDEIEERIVVARSRVGYSGSKG